MGEMADMLLEQAIEGDWCEMEHWYDARPRKVLQCRACKKRNLCWHNVKGHWVLFEPDGSRLHTCSGYTPPIDVLKELAKSSINLTRMKELDKLYNRMMKAGGFRKIVNIVTDSQLLDLFVRVNREHNVEYEDVGWGRPTDYSKQLSHLRAELLKRMNKQNV
jgi:hypothetical protein